MNTLKFLLLAIAGILFSSCSSRFKEIKIKELTDKEAVQLVESGVKGIPFPEGSKAFEQNTLSNTKITLPEEVYYVVKDEEGNVFSTSELGVRCTCSRGSGCSPVRYDGSYYCVMNGGCKSCSSSTMIQDISSKEFKNVQIVGVLDKRAGLKTFVKKNVKIEKGSLSAALSTNTETKQYGITEDFFKCKEVQEYMDDLAHFMYPNGMPDFIKNSSPNIPNDYVYVKANFAGNNILITTPKKYVDDETIYYDKIDDIDDAGAICKCLKGNGCVRKTHFLATYCVAGSCSDCVLK